MSSNAKQSKETQDKRYFIFNMVFQSKTSFTLINCIEKSLAPLYKKNKKEDTPIKEKNVKFRLNEKNYITILMRLDYFFNLLEEHSYKFNNKIWIMCGISVFSKSFPNITNLFYERFLLRKLIPGIEEGELDDDPDITDEDFYLYDIAQRLSNLGLRVVDISNDTYRIYGDYVYGAYDYDLDDGAYVDIF